MAHTMIVLCEISYSDLESSSPPHAADNEDVKSLRSTVADVLGPSGPGLLSVIGIPLHILKLRQNLLIQARELALSHPELLKRILKEHKLGSDVALKNPRRNVSSFATNLKFDQSFPINGSFESEKNFQKGDLSNLRYRIEMLGSWMRNLGLRIAQLCDEAIGGIELGQSLTESESAKARLIHYHSSTDNDTEESDMWQQWHYDYGIFTVLTAPMFLSGDGIEADGYPDGLSCLQIFDENENTMKMVKADPQSFLIQVGESAEILSKGKLRATLHSVFRSTNDLNLSREMFVLFLQPSWTKTLTLSKDFISDKKSNFDNPPNTKSHDLHRVVPPLSSRLKNGMTFAEFSRETTKQYYGGTGLQS